MGVWQCQSKGDWGPIDLACPADFTACFEDSVLKVLPVAFLVAVGITRMARLLKRPSLAHPYHSWAQTTKLASIGILFALSFSILLLQQRVLFTSSPPSRHRQELLAQLVGKGTKPMGANVGVELMASLAEIGSLFFSFALARLENKKSYLASNVLLLFWLLNILVGATKLRTLVSNCPGGGVDWSYIQAEDDISAGAMTERWLIGLRLTMLAVVFGLECRRKDQGIVLREDSMGYEMCPEEEANVFSIASFNWVTGLMRKGYSKPLTMDDLWALRKQDRSKHVSKSFAESWDRELKENKPSLARALAMAFGTPFYIAGMWKLINDLLGFAQPLLLREMLRFVISYKTDSAVPQPLYRGYTIACLMFLSSLGQTAVVHQYFHLCFRTGMNIRTALVTAIYQKSLRLSNSARQEFTVGEIVNHMSIDAQRIQDLTANLHILWSGLLQIIISLYLLYATLGWAIFAGIAVMLLMIPLNARLSIRMQALQKQHMAYKDLRIKLMNELLNGMRVIKLYAWENIFLQKVLHIRNDKELGAMKRMGYISAVQMFTWASTPFLVSLVNFGVYTVVMGRNLTTDVLFAAIALFNLLQFPLAMLPWVISSCIEANVSLGRVYKFLLSSEVDPQSIIIEVRQARQHSTSESSSVSLSGENTIDASVKYTILATDASYSWHKNSSPVVSNINLALKENSLLSIVGRVGSGKSSLIATLCGDLERMSGEIRIRGSVAFVPQQAWIMNDTVQANILFGNAFDPDYYRKTIDACCLQQDFAMLIGGDMAEIGERGINLSGGQKARISLARAVYARADIYLFDDPLSAVDAHVSRTIFDKVIGPKGLLVDSTRVFVTHQIQYLAQSTSILMLRDGRVVEQGTFQDLMNKRTDVYQLMTDFGKDTGNQSRDSHLERPEHQGSSSSAKQASRGTTDDPEQDASTAPSTHQGSSRSSTESSRTINRSSTSEAPEQPLVNRYKAKDVKGTENNIIIEEKMNQGRVGKGVYWAYAKACSYRAVISYILSMIFSQSLQICMSLWLTYWSRSYDNSSDSISSIGAEESIGVSVNSSISASSTLTAVGHGTMYYVGIYALLGLVFGVLTVYQSIILQVHCGIRSAKVLHERMLRSVLRSPMVFFDTTPLGRILNRFSKDQSTIDEVLPRTFAGYSHNLLAVITILLVILFSTPTLLIIIVPFTGCYLWLQRYFLATSREIRRLDSVSRSPIFAHFQETLGGISTIRAYRRQERFIQGNEQKLDENLRAFYPSTAGNRWLAFRLECLSSVIIFGSAFLSVVSLARHVPVDPGLVGLSLTYALNITQTLNWMVRQYTEVESNIVAVERLREYVDLKPEAPEEIENHRPPENWPTEGRVEFVDYETRYRPGLELVLRGVNCSIRAHEKIGICGRTGAGKSSLTLSLFRIIESVKGQIFVDGIDVSTLRLFDVRSRFSIIPQDPVLFAGTIRFNLNPLGTKSDLELWQALEDSYLKEYISNLMEGGLNAVVLEQGDNFSVGQRQLICLARALLRKSSLLILDEATAAIDLETDALVQRIIRQKFKECTILTIAHRIDSVMDSDRIMVLDQGRVVEFDPPGELLKDRNSVFYSLAKESGNV